MKWISRFCKKLMQMIGFKLKFTLIDSDDVSWEIATDAIHTIIQDAYTIYIIYKKEGSYKVFPNTATNRANLPSVRLAQEAKYGS